MKTLFFYAVVFFIFHDTFGQVSGVLTTPGGQPVAFANVLLLNGADTSLVKAALTNEKGVYQIANTSPGKYILRVSSIGYQTWDSPLFELTETDSRKDFGTRVLQQHVKEMDEVIIRAEKPLFQQQAYGTVVNVESSILTKGNSVLQVLERSPGVVIDYRNNGIALNGKNGVIVMLNGKLMRIPMEQVVILLNGMNANDIEKIELMTTPPAKYDAEGSAGMINIVLKKNKKAGTNGTVSLTAGYGWGEKAAGSINLSHNTGKMDVHGSYSFFHDRSYNYLLGEGTQDFPALGGPMYVLFWNNRKPLQNNHDATLGLDARLNSKTTASVDFTYNNLNFSSTAYNRRELNVLPDSLLFFSGNLHAVSRWRSLISSVYLERQMREGEKISFNADYLYYTNKNPTEVQSIFVNKNGDQAGTNNDTLFSPLQKGMSNTTIQVSVGKIDYLKPLSKKMKLEAGVKFTYTRSGSLSGIQSLVDDVWVTRPETTNDIVMKESISAAYASVNTQMSSSASLVIGLRYEYSHTRMDNAIPGEKSIDRKLGSFFPSIFFSGKFTNDADWQASYTRRISRPTYNDLSSFVGYNDPMSVFTGNPLLRPSITNNIKLGYTYHSYAFSLLLSRDDYPISRWQLTSSPSGALMYFSPQNLDYQNSLTFQTTLPGKINEWWSVSYGFTGGWRAFKVNHTKYAAGKTYFGYSTNFSQTFKLPKNFGLEIAGWYNSAGYDGTVKTDAFGALNAGIKKELQGNRGTFQLSVSDILRTIKYRSYYGALTEEAFDGKSRVTYNPESRKSPIIKLTYTRSFGSGTAKAQRKQESGSQNEQDRIMKN